MHMMNAVLLARMATRNLESESGHLPFGSMWWIIYAGISCVLVLFAGIMSGLTLGLMSLSLVDLEILQRSGNSSEKKQAAVILPVVQKQHQLLVTLLLCNACAMEALPLYLDKLVNQFLAIVLSVTFVLFFGEVIPQAICTRYGLAVGSNFVWLVRILMIICYPISYPIGKVLDCLLGHNEALFRRAQLKALVSIHRKEAGKGGELTHDETTIISGALDLTEKMNEYERARNSRIEINKKKMESLGIKHIASSMTSLVESTKEKKRKGKKNATREDDEYFPDEDEERQQEDEYQKEREILVSKKARHFKNNEGNKNGCFIPLMSVEKFLKMNKKEQQAIAMDIVQKAISSQQHMEDNERNEDVIAEKGVDGEETREQCSSENNMEPHYDEERQLIGLGSELGDARISYADHEQVNDKEDMMNIEGEEEEEQDKEQQLINAGSVRKTRGMVYCRKLTLLPPGEKIEVEFDEDGNAIGPNSSLFAFFLGQQVRNKSVCPIQVKGWEDYKSETLDHLWACIKEKCSFDDAEYRRECVMKHARRLFRDARSKLKKKYFNHAKLKTKDDCLKNKPDWMNKTEWKFLVDYWSDEKVKVKSEKAKESRGCVRMPHYNGTQSFARLRQEIMETNEGKCSRLDVLVRSRKRKSKKDVNTEALKNNFDAIDEIKKLKEERDQGLTTKTDEQIFQDVLGKDKHGYLRAYGPGKSITQYFKVKPSRLDLTQEAIEVQKKAEQAIEEARKDAENARAEAEKAKEEAENARAEAEQAKQESLAVRSDVDKKIEASNKVWQDKFNQLLNLVRGSGSLNNNDSGSEGSSN